MKADRRNKSMAARDWRVPRARARCCADVRDRRVGRDAGAEDVRLARGRRERAGAAVKVHDRTATIGRARQRRRLDFVGRRGGRSRRRRALRRRLRSRSTRSRATATRRSSTIGNDDFPFAFPIVKTGDALALRHRRRARTSCSPAASARTSSTRSRCCRRSSTRSATTRPRIATATACSTTRRSSRAAPASTTGCTGRRRPASRRARSARSSRSAAGEGYAQEREGADAVPRLLLPDAQGPGQERAKRGAFDYVVHGRGDRRLRRRRVSGEVRQLRHHDLHRQPGRQGLPGGSRTEDASEGGAMQRFDPGKGWSPVKAQ